MSIDDEQALYDPSPWIQVRVWRYQDGVSAVWTFKVWDQAMCGSTRIPTVYHYKASSMHLSRHPNKSDRIVTSCRFASFSSQSRVSRHQSTKRKSKHTVLTFHRNNTMASETQPLNILISGSGIAGPCLAFWLHKLIPTCRITILERSPTPRHGGQAVDLRSFSVPIVSQMGLLDLVRSKTTTEEGVQFVYLDGITRATFPASGNIEAQSATSEFEVLRGDLAKILMDATQALDRITYVFDEMVESITQTGALDNRVDVTFANRLPPATYDLVVGADGMMSRTRRLTFGLGHEDDESVRRLGQYAALFTMPRTESDTKFAQWYNATRGRLLLLRPDSYGTTRAYVSVTDPDLSRFDVINDAINRGDRKAQEDWFEREFEGAGWESERCIREMKKAEDYYLQQVAQVKMEKWSHGSVALLGDAAYCPSPISGVVSSGLSPTIMKLMNVQGAGSAIIGAYVLAGEISRGQNDIPKALEQYEKVLRPYVEKAQRLIPGAPQIANPQTEWGVWTFNKLTGVASSAIMKRFGGLVGRFLPAFGGTADFPFPEYEVTATRT
jgi:2-polyprenyl-6-methoxyphenol hydroxylase-like FAD-dependent oxidoreductase